MCRLHSERGEWFWGEPPVHPAGRCRWESMIAAAQMRIHLLVERSFRHPSPVGSPNNPAIKEIRDRSGGPLNEARLVAFWPVNSAFNLVTDHPNYVSVESTGKSGLKCIGSIDRIKHGPAAG
jgi:hypothetical protein